MTEVPIEIPEPQSQEENLEAERPEWLPDKFKSAEDLARSYGELESKLGQTTQQLKEQQEQWQEFLSEQDAAAQLQAQQQAQQQLPQWQDQLYAQYEQDPLGTTALMIQNAINNGLQQYEQRGAMQREKSEETAALVAGEIAFRDATSRYQDFAQFKDAIVTELQDEQLYPEEGWTNPTAVTKYIDSAYAKTKLEALTSGQASLEEQAALAVQDDKINAQTISGAAGRPDSPDDDEEFYARLKRAANQNWSSFRGVA